MSPDASLLWPDESGSKRGPKPKLSLERIVQAAISVADSEGLDAVSMQRIADELDATKMSLYRYLPSKAELTAVMLDTAIGAAPEAADSGDSGDWRMLLAAWATQMHSGFAARPWALELAVGARVLGPNELAWFEGGLRAMTSTTLTAAERLDVLALLSGHVRGIVQQQQSGRTPEAEIARLMAGILETHADRFPEVAAAFEAAASEGGSDQALGFGIDRILDGVAALMERRAYP
jgi:AcrR family transcriptional regulator